MILGDYCNCAPEELSFTYGIHQKPSVESNGRVSQTVAFNLSHTKDAMQIAIAAKDPVGIDVEDPRREFDVDGLVAECLTGEEARSLSRASASHRRNGLIRYWVHKEAFLKCVGTGFSVAPKEVHVEFDNGGRSEMRCLNPMANVVLCGCDLECKDGHLAALATREPDYILHSIDV
jgi:4'-phosphopantetheinyl transferase